MRKMNKEMITIDLEDYVICDEAGNKKGYYIHDEQLDKHAVENNLADEEGNHTEESRKLFCAQLNKRAFLEFADNSEYEIKEIEQYIETIVDIVADYACEYFGDTDSFWDIDCETKLWLEETIENEIEESEIDIIYVDDIDNLVYDIYERVVEKIETINEYTIDEAREKLIEEYTEKLDDYELIVIVMSIDSDDSICDIPSVSFYRNEKTCKTFKRQVGYYYLRDKDDIIDFFSDDETVQVFLNLKDDIKHRDVEAMIEKAEWEMERESLGFLK